MNYTFLENKLNNMPEDIMNEIGEKIDILVFKYNKLEYLEENIKQRIEKMREEGGTGHEKILYDFESYLITSRTIIDILMHCINICLKLNIEHRDVTLGSIYHHPDLDEKVRNILRKFSHNRNSIIWDFIYTNRNKIIHQTSIDKLIPYDVNFISENEVNFYIYWKDERYKLEVIINQSNRFLKNFTYNLIEFLSVAANKK